MTDKHSARTPGPWTCADIPGAGVEIKAPVYLTQGVELPPGLEKPILTFHLADPQNVLLAYERWVQFEPKGWHEMQLANGTLMAAAPEPHEALKAYMFLEQTNGGKNPHPVGTNRYHAFELGRAALAKAEGREPVR